MAMKITSSAFSDGKTIPRDYTCEGADRSPPLAWTGVPSTAKSLVLLCDDPDAPGGTWHHWAVFDIPATDKGLAENLAKSERVGAIRQGLNDFRKVGYGGPCPPPGHGPHHYRFRLLALSVDRLDLPARPGCRYVERAAAPHRVAEAVLVGIYER
jgi:Raf kinase inhibitor-like YbhB/YbcL family protein